MKICTQNVKWTRQVYVNMLSVELFETVKNWKTSILKGAEKQTVIGM